MRKIILAMLICLSVVTEVKANAANYLSWFNIKMDMDLSDLAHYITKMKKANMPYDKGYVSRFKIGKKFNQTFSRTIKRYGMSESRIKNRYEDDLMDMINMLPKETYPYIGPMLHEIPGMSEKILNIPGIKESKNKFPEKINEKYMAIEDIEFLSPALYVVLMPDFWSENTADLDNPGKIPAQKPKRHAKLPDYLLPQTDQSAPKADDVSAGAVVKEVSAQAKPMGRTIYPTLTSSLTSEDAAAFLNTIDDIVEWGNKNNKKNLAAILRAGYLLDGIEQDKGTALLQNGLKDLVNPCQRLVLKTRIAGVYHDFGKVVASKGFSPEEWAYTCDKTIKAFRAAEANHTVAYSVQYHRRGYYDKYIKILPEKWREAMFETEAAIIAMYAVFREDVDSIKPIKDDIRKKFNQIDGKLLLEPIIY